MSLSMVVCIGVCDHVCVCLCMCMCMCVTVNMHMSEHLNIQFILTQVGSMEEINRGEHAKLQ